MAAAMALSTMPLRLTKLVVPLVPKNNTGDWPSHFFTRAASICINLVGMKSGLASAFLQASARALMASASSCCLAC